MKKFTKYPITASSLVDEFMKYHELPGNYEDGYLDGIYDCLDAFGLSL